MILEKSRTDRHISKKKKRKSYLKRNFFNCQNEHFPNSIFESQKSTDIWKSLRFVYYVYQCLKQFLSNF